jgi:hypothetical protein
MHAVMVVREHALGPRAPAGWRLDVVWKLQNHAEGALYFLAHGPLSILDGQPIVLNHAMTGHPIAIDPNLGPEMEFLVVEALGSLELRRTYPLPPIDLQENRMAVGRFAVSYEAPDPKWIPGHVWNAVKEWQKILESSPFELAIANQ